MMFEQFPIFLAFLCFFVFIALLVFRLLTIFVVKFMSYRRFTSLYTSVAREVKDNYLTACGYNVEELQTVTFSDLHANMQNSFTDDIPIKDIELSSMRRRRFLDKINNDLAMWVQTEVLNAEGIDVTDNKLVNPLENMRKRYIADSDYDALDMLFDLKEEKLIMSEEQVPLFPKPVTPVLHKDKPLLILDSQLDEHWETLLTTLGSFTQEEVNSISLGADFIETLKAVLANHDVPLGTVEGWNLKYDLKGTFMALY